ncbi:MAG: Ig-like domain-containing protein [Oscillospiraceae bacterium]|nr:Ig-like domain-containing protein [Oscillospiraceae bacterium]
MRSFSTKRILSLLVAVCMLVAMLPASLISASAAEVGTVYEYKFWDCMTAEGATGTGTAFSTSYQASQDANVGSAKWMLGPISNNAYVVSTAPYHIFGFGTKGGSDSITWKIEVPESAEYKATWNITEYSSSAPVDVYLHKVGTAESYLYTVDYSGISSAAARAVSTEHVMLEAGDYYLTVKQLGNGNEAYRYFTHKSFALEVTGAYNSAAISAVVLDRTNMALGMDSIEFITPSVLPAEADDGSVVYTFESSDENVAIVDEDGLVMPIGPGFATITVSVENGKFATANVLVTENVTFEYDFTKGYSGPWSSSWKEPTMITYGNTMKGSPDEIHLHATNLANGGEEVTTDPWAFYALHGAATLTGSSSFAGSTTAPGIGAQNCGKGSMRGYTFVAKNEGDAISFSILVPAEGTFIPSVDYSRGSGYGSASIYLAPIDAVNPIASDYKLGDINLTAAALTDHVTTEFAEVELSAGEYIVSLAGPGCTVTFWQNFALTNPNAVKSVAYTRDSLNIAVGETAEAATVVLPESAPDKSLTYTSDSDCVTISEDGKVTGVSKGTAVITATSNANDAIQDTITINVGEKIFHYNFMKSHGFGLKPAYRDDKYLKDTVYSSDFKYTRSGTADEVGLSYESYGWKIGPTVNSSDWTWSQSAESLGLFVYVKNIEEDADGNAIENGYASMHLDVPVAGNYDLISVHSDWTGGAPCDYYFAPVSAANPIDEQYKVGSTDHKGDTNQKVEEVVGEVSVLTAGEYVLTYYSEAASPVFLYGVTLSDADIVVPVESVTLDKSGTIAIAGEETVTATATVLPANASDKTVTWTSSDDEIATVVDGVVTPVGAGYATITATANDGSGAKASFIVQCNMTLKYTYDFWNSMKPLYNTSDKANVMGPRNGFGASYAASEAAGSAPWMYYGSSTGYEYFDYTSSSYGGFGVFAMNHTSLGFTNTIKIRVDEGAKYTGMLKMSDWSASNSFDVYIAPVTAADKTADEYKVGSYTPTGATNHGYELPLKTMDMPAGEYYVSFKLTKVNGGTLIGLFDLKLYESGELAAVEAADITVGTTNGASIRTSGVQGLRFVSSIAKSGDFGKVVEYGTLLIPTEYLGTNELVLGYRAGEKKCAAQVPAVYLYTDTETETSFTAVLTNIAEENYTREISARAYAIYEDANGNRQVVYSDVTTSRSPYTVAKNGLADASASETDKAIFQAIVDAVENPTTEA